MTPPHQAASAAAAAPAAARMDWTGWQTKFVASPPEQEPGFGVDPPSEDERATRCTPARIHQV